jgi:hypothetical protein
MCAATQVAALFCQESIGGACANFVAIDFARDVDCRIADMAV